jgi:hypothetical protein
VQPGSSNELRCCHLHCTVLDDAWCRRGHITEQHTPAQSGPYACHCWYVVCALLCVPGGSVHAVYLLAAVLVRCQVPTLAYVS